MSPSSYTTWPRSTRRAGNPSSEQLYRQALAIKEDLLGPDHPEVALVANNLGTLLQQQHRAAEAADLFRRALAIAEHSYPPGHPTTTGILGNLEALAQLSSADVARRCGSDGSRP
jgi:Tfp pilus assembly protein PilF